MLTTRTLRTLMWTLTGGLFGLGLVMVASTTTASGTNGFVLRQAAAIGIGLVAAVVAASGAYLLLTPGPDRWPAAGIVGLVAARLVPGVDARLQLVALRPALLVVEEVRLRGGGGVEGPAEDAEEEVEVSVAVQVGERRGVVAARLRRGRRPGSWGWSPPGSAWRGP